MTAGQWAAWGVAVVLLVLAIRAAWQGASEAERRLLSRREQ